MVLMKKAMFSLVVDDTPFAETAGEVLRELGCEVEIARSGSAGILAAITGVPHVALIADPVGGLDGAQVALAIRKLPEGEGIVLICIADEHTGFERPLFNAQVARADGHDELRATLEAQLGRLKSPRSKAAAAPPAAAPLPPLPPPAGSAPVQPSSAAPPVAAHVETGTSFVRWNDNERWTAVPSSMAEKFRAAGASVISAQEMGKH